MQEVDKITQELDRTSGQCRFLHDWSAWANPEPVEMNGFLGAMGGVVIKFQKRYCFRCRKEQMSPVRFAR